MPSPIVIEFEPVRTDSLAATTSWSLGVAGLAACALAGSALALGLVTRRAGRLQERLEAERRLAVLGEMAAVMAHEIRNPLASMKGHAQLLEEQLGSATPQGAKASRLVREILRLEDLTEDLLGLARGERVEPAPADPSEVMRLAVAEVSVPVTLELDQAPECWTLDAGRIRQVLGNILRNAAQAAPEGSSIEAGVGLEKESLVFRVRDHGPGVPPAQRERIFEPFHTTRVRGTGLGLPIARRIVAAHGGSIGVEDAPGGGALFRVVLPRRPPPWRGRGEGRPDGVEAP